MTHRNALFHNVPNPGFYLGSWTGQHLCSLISLVAHLPLSSAQNSLASQLLQLHTAGSIHVCSMRGSHSRTFLSGRSSHTAARGERQSPTQNRTETGSARQPWTEETIQGDRKQLDSATTAFSVQAAIKKASTKEKSRHQRGNIWGKSHFKVTASSPPTGPLHLLAVATDKVQLHFQKF